MENNNKKECGCTEGCGCSNEHTDHVDEAEKQCGCMESCGCADEPETKH